MDRSWGLRLELPNSNSDSNPRPPTTPPPPPPHQPTPNHSTVGRIDLQETMLRLCVSMLDDPPTIRNTCSRLRHCHQPSRSRGVSIRPVRVPALSHLPGSLDLSLSLSLLVVCLLGCGEIGDIGMTEKSHRPTRNTSSQFHAPTLKPTARACNKCRGPHAKQSMHHRSLSLNVKRS